MLLLKGLARLVTFLLLALLALAGLAVAVFSIGEGEATVSLPGLAELVGLHLLRDRVGDLLTTVESGGVDAVPALAGVGAVALGCLLLVGALGSRRERLVSLPHETEGQGALGARRRPLGHMAVALADQARDVTPTKVKVRASRRGPGGRVEVAVDHPKTAEGVADRTVGSLEPLTKPFGLRARVRARPASRVR